MNILNHFFRKNKTVTEKQSKIDWNVLQSVEQIKEIKEQSENNLIGIFKHSTRCGISSSVLNRFNKMYPEDAVIKMYYLDILSYREVSDELSYTFQVIHQSPQLLLIKKQELILHASHYNILDVEL